MRIATAFAAAITAAAPLSAEAEGFTFEPLGNQGSQDTCLQRAMDFGNIVLETYGGHSIGTTDYGVVLYDFRNNGPHDIVLVCGEGFLTLVISTVDDTQDAEREVISALLTSDWRSMF